MTIVKTTITVAVLHEAEYPIHKLPLDCILNDMDDGECIGAWEIAASNNVPKEEVEKELLAVGNDGTFFGDSK